MYPIRERAAAYDRVAAMFSPDGRLYQVEYASKIVAQGTMGCGMVYKDGILFGADKKVSSKLLIPDSIEKVFMIDDNIGAVSSGLVGDARRLIQYAREKAQEHNMIYGEHIHIENLVKDISNIKQTFTQYAGMRPFGVSFIIGGIDDTGKRLFETEPSGSLAEYKAVAIGTNRKAAMELFEKEYYEDISFDDAIRLMLKALQKGLAEKEKLDYNRLEFAYISDGKVFTRIPKQKIKNIATKRK